MNLLKGQIYEKSNLNQVKTEKKKPFQQN